MNKFVLPRRNIQKERRAKRAEKRKLRSSAATLKVSSAKKAASGVSGKKARKLQKQWRQAQKEALQSGLVTMRDIEMMAVDGGGGDQASSQPKVPKTGRAFLMKKRLKPRLKSSSSKRKQVTDPVATSNPAAEALDLHHLVEGMFGSGKYSLAELGKVAVFTSINMKSSPGYELPEPDLEEQDPKLYESISARCEVSKYRKEIWVVTVDEGDELGLLHCKPGMKVT